MIWLLDLLAVRTVAALSRRMPVVSAWRLVHLLLAAGLCLALGLGFRLAAPVDPPDAVFLQ